jgi:hypothetical protein
MKTIDRIYTRQERIQELLDAEQERNSKDTKVINIGCTLKFINN